MRRSARGALSRLALTATALALLAAGCEGRDARVGARSNRSAPGGNAETGRRVLASWGCGSCHHIPGVIGANAYVGPPLDGWSERQYIAGSLVNTPENLILWIMDPQAVEPGTAMPDTDAPENVARDMAAYLYTLEPD